MVAGLRENSPPVRASGSESTTSMASSTSRTAVTDSSGPKISSRLTGDCSSSPKATLGATNHPSSGNSSAEAVIRSPARSR